MAHRTRRLVRLVWSLPLIALVVLVPADRSMAKLGPLTPADTPIPVVSEVYNEWTINEGLLYWANHCYGEEFRGDGYLRRKPTNGGTTRTLSTVTPIDCYTFRNMAADASGLYYYSVDEASLYVRPVASPYDPATKLYTMASWRESPIDHLALDGDYIYWLTTGTNNISQLLRINKNGAGLETVASDLSYATDLHVVGGTVYWLDNDGLWKTSVSCGSLPCAKSRVVSTRGDHLMYYVPARSILVSYELFWVVPEDTIDYVPQRIRRCVCKWLPHPFPDPPTLSCTTSTIYTAPSTNWNIGELGTNGSYLFWPEQNFSESDGRLRRMPRNGGSAEDIAVNLPYIERRLFTDNQYVYFGEYAGSIGLYRLPFNASAIVRDLSAAGLEVTQGIQSMSNDVPLVANKTTFVRAYGSEISGPNAVAVEAYLYGTRGGAPVPGSPRTPINGTRALATGGSYDRARVDDGWLFQLPDEWTNAGAINLRLVVDPRSLYSDPNRANNETQGDFTFTRKAPLCAVFVPVRTNSPNYSSPTDNPNFGAMMDTAERLWPVSDIWLYHQSEDVAELELCWWGPFPYPCYGPYELQGDSWWQDDSWKVLLSLKVRDAFTDDPDECDDAGADTHYVGMVHPSTDTHVTGGTKLGVAWMDSSVAWVKFPPHSPTSSPNPTDPAWPDAGATFAHELAHNLDRKHVDCGGPDDVDASYPYPTNQIDDVGANNHYGFNSETRTAIAPNAVVDLMSYCRPYWTSDYTWKGIYNRLASTSASLASTRPSLASAANAIFVSGAITPSLDTGILNYAWVYPTTDLSTGMLKKWESAVGTSVGPMTYQSMSPAASYRLRLLDSQNNILADHLITPTQSLDDNPANATQGFVASLPAPGGTVARLELLSGSTTLDSRAPGSSTPAVTFVKPAGGETFGEQMPIIWRATDADTGDRLLYNVQYSPDNGTHWFSLLTDFPAPSDSNNITVTLTHLTVPGSGSNTGRIRVAASDGYHTGLATSPAFTLADRKPEVYLMSPISGTSAPAVQPVSLKGAATDAEDGGLGGDALQWALTGETVGTGEQALIYGLASGDYEVALTARDSTAQTATAQTRFEILPLGIPQGSDPLLDGFCDDAPYADGAQVPLRPYDDGSQATVRLVRDSRYLWACFSNMKLGSADPGAFVGLWVDVDNSRDEFAQPDDYAFFVGEDGGYYTWAGNGTGGFTEPGPSGLQAQIGANAGVWSAELRIDASVIGNWNHLIGLSLGHYWVNSVGNDYTWPYELGWNRPTMWSPTALGSLPQINGLSPALATVGGPDLTLVITGENFVDGATVRWGSTNLPTTFGSSNQLTAIVSAAHLASAGTVQVTVRNPGSDLDSNAVTFVVRNPVPVISGLNPASVSAGGAAFVLTVNGSNLVNGATVLWNGVACPTTYVNSSQLTASINESYIAQGRTISVMVRNPEPDSQISNTMLFVVQPQARFKVYLPLVLRN